MKLHARTLTPVLAMFAALVLPPASARPAAATELDSGRYTITLRGEKIGWEQFFFDQYSDSLAIQSMVRERIYTPDGRDSLKKSMTLFVSAFDLDLRAYKSTHVVGHDRIVRNLAMSDTVFTSYREVNDHGTADVLSRPPGRIYVHDPDVYTLFDVISRNLNTQQFDQRPITLMVLGPRDTTIEVMAKRLPPEKITWGSRTVQARRLALDDGYNRVLIWSDERGRMLRFEDPSSGLRVTRDPASAKSAKSKSSTAKTAQTTASKPVISHPAPKPSEK